jgi:hypothetical protein
MKAFLKRRWILLSFVVMLLACSAVDWVRRIPESNLDWQLYGMHRGYFFWCENEIPDIFEAEIIEESSIFVAQSIKLPLLPEIRWPILGALPWYSAGRSMGLPIWIPLVAILGWIVFRELRWREKRAKTGDSSPTQ